MSSRQDHKRAARERREAQERLAARSAARRRRIRLAALTAVAALAVAIPAILLGTSSESRTEGSTIAAAPIPARQAIELREATRLAGARRISHPYAFGIDEHTTAPVRYPTNPPTNGPHFPTWTLDGNYAGLPAPPTTQVVHAQEHGRIVVQYRPGLPRETLVQLVGLYEESPEHVLLVENATDMPCDVAVTAWGQGLLCPRVTPRTFDALRAFRDRYRDRGPETVA